MLKGELICQWGIFRKWSTLKSNEYDGLDFLIVTSNLILSNWLNKLFWFLTWENYVQILIINKLPISKKKEMVVGKSKLYRKLIIIKQTLNSIIDTQRIISTRIPMKNKHNRNNHFRHNNHIWKFRMHLSTGKMGENSIAFGQAIYPKILVFFHWS